MAAQRSRPKAAAKPPKQAAKGRMVIQRTLYGAAEPDEVIEGEVQIFETTPAQVSISAGVTKNTGNYESLKLNVIYTVPCYVEDLDQTADNTAVQVSDRLNAEVEQYMNGGEIGPEEELDPENNGEPEPEGEEQGELEVDVPNEGGDEVDEYGNPYEYDADGNRLENEYTEDGYLIQHDDQGAPYIVNDDGEVEPIEYDGDAEGQEEDLPVEEADPEPEPAPPARNPRSSRRGAARGGRRGRS